MNPPGAHGGNLFFEVQEDADVAEFVHDEGGLNGVFTDESVRLTDKADKEKREEKRRREPEGVVGVREDAEVGAFLSPRRARSMLDCAGQASGSGSRDRK